MADYPVPLVTNFPGLIVSAFTANAPQGGVTVAIGPAPGSAMEGTLEIDAVGIFAPVLMSGWANGVAPLEGADTAGLTAALVGDDIWLQQHFAFDGTATKDGSANANPGWFKSFQLVVAAAENFAAGHHGTSVTMGTRDIHTQNFLTRLQFTGDGHTQVPNGFFGLPIYTFATLPSTPSRGMMCVITDATVNTFAAVISVGGGSNVVLAWYTGAAWHCFGA